MGNPGNTGELSGDGVWPGGNGPDAIVGAVDYVYEIGKYEVTAGQYTEFLNAVAATDTYGLYNTDMWSSDVRLQDPAERLVGQLHVQRGVRPREPSGELCVVGRCGAVHQLAAQRPADGGRAWRPPRTGRTTSTARRASAALMAVTAARTRSTGFPPRTNGTRRPTTRTTA